MDDKQGMNVHIDNNITIQYTDNVFMNANEDGIVLDIGQKLLSSNQVRIVARIGMSRNHAKKLIAELSKLLLMTDGNLASGNQKN